jgi:hypothetical protein
MRSIFIAVKLSVKVDSSKQAGVPKADILVVPTPETVKQVSSFNLFIHNIAELF